MDQGLSHKDIILKALEAFEVEILYEQDIFYKCNCDRERVEKAILSLGKDELEQMANEEEQIEVCCHFCDKKYYFKRDELKKML